jgi:GNAT superfamily N-acetyltransferase
MKTFRVRVATTKDIDVLVRQRHMMFEDMRPRTAEEHLVGDRAYREWAVGKMKKGHLRCYLVTDKKGEVAGGCGIWLREVQPSPGHGSRLMPYLLSMFTEPKFRRKGVATLVVKEAERWARASGYPSMNLHASKKGRKVYKKLGWKRGWEMYTEFE